MSEAKRRIVFYDAYAHTYGGAQIVTHLLAVGLRERGWDTELVVPVDGPLVDEVRRDGIAVTVLAPPPALLRYGRTTDGTHIARAALALPRYWLRVANHLRGAAILHVDDHRGILLAGAAARLAGVPCVWHVHSVQRHAALNRLGARLSNEIILPATTVLGPMPELGRRRTPTVVHNPVQPRIINLTARKPPERPMLLTMARYHPDKGLDVLLAATARLRREVPDVQVVVLGESQTGWEHYGDELRTLVANLDLAGVVRFPGRTERPEDALATASIYVQPSRDATEVSPLAILEAMALGVPVVASRVGGILETVRHGVTGLLVAPEDPEALAAALLELLQDPSRAEEMGAQGRLDAQREHTVEATLDRTESVYARLGDSGR